MAAVGWAVVVVAAVGSGHLVVLLEHLLQGDEESFGVVPGEYQSLRQVDGFGLVVGTEVAIHAKVEDQFLARTMVDPVV
ncbi:MAG TPA: hypothetical protein VN688_23445 [Gemmataceae bacterium]|nr:hypothetical protein [Gemmataceae bacterium]